MYVIYMVDVLSCLEQVWLPARRQQEQGKQG